MKKLFIIGNGFDREHDLPTSYWDFRKYVLTLYPDAESYYFVPESMLMPKGNEEYDEEEVAGYIVNIIDSCRDGWWSELEAYIYSSTKIFILLRKIIGTHGFILKRIRSTNCIKTHIC